MYYRNEWDALRSPPELRFYLVERIDLNNSFPYKATYVACFKSKQQAIEYINKQAQDGNILYCPNIVDSSGLQRNVNLYNAPTDIPGLEACFEAIAKQAKEYTREKSEK